MRHYKTAPNHSAIDLRSFPTQTEVSFWIIVIVILGTMIAASIGPSPVLMWPVALSMFILPARALLALPDRELAKQDQEATEQLRESGVLGRLQKTITELARQMGYDEPIKLVISQQSNEMRAFGSWYRHYIFLGAQVARKLESDLQSEEHHLKAKALLIHEIAHLVNRDVQRVGYTRELLRSSFVVIGWWMLFLVGWLSAAYFGIEALLAFDIHQVPGIDPLLADLVQPLIALSPEERAEIVEKTQSISIQLLISFIINTLWFIIAMAFVLWLFYWRRMLRLQEHYADYLVLNITKSPTALLEAIGRYGSSLTIDHHEKYVFHTLNNILSWFRIGRSRPSGSAKAAYISRRLEFLKDKVSWSQKIEQMEQLREDISFFMMDEFSHFFHHRSWYQKLSALFSRMRNSFKVHPTYQERAEFLQNPLMIYQDWVTVTVGITVLVLTLDVLLVTPLVAYHFIPIHFSTLAIFALVSGWLLPFIVTQQPFKKKLAKMLGIIYGIRLIWLSLNLSLLFILNAIDPSWPLTAINLYLFAGSRIASIPSSLPTTDPIGLIISIIPSLVGLQLLSIVGVLLLLFSYYHLYRREIGATQPPTPRNGRVRYVWRVFALSVVCLTLFLTPLSDILREQVDELLIPSKILGYGLGLLTAVVLLLSLRRKR